MQGLSAYRQKEDAPGAGSDIEEFIYLSGCFGGVEAGNKQTVDIGRDHAITGSRDRVG